MLSWCAPDYWKSITTLAQCEDVEDIRNLSFHILSPWSSWVQDPPQPWLEASYFAPPHVFTSTPHHCNWFCQCFDPHICHPGSHVCFSIGYPWLCFENSDEISRWDFFWRDLPMRLFAPQRAPFTQCGYWPGFCGQTSSLKTSGIWRDGWLLSILAERQRIWQPGIKSILVDVDAIMLMIQ